MDNVQITVTDGVLKISGSSADILYAAPTMLLALLEVYMDSPENLKQPNEEVDFLAHMSLLALREFNHKHKGKYSWEKL